MSRPAGSGWCRRTCGTRTTPARRRTGTGRPTSTPTIIPHGIAEQQYLPDELAGADYYRPTDHGAEAAIAERLAKINELLGRT